MASATSTRADLVAGAGIAIGGALGMAGTFVADASVRQTLWAIDGIALVVAAALLAVRFIRSDEPVVAAGFLVFLAGESLLLSDEAAGLQASVPSYGGGVALWSAALVLVSAPAVFPIWARLTGGVAAVLFAVSAALIFWGEPLLPTAAPLPSAGYPFLVLTFAGWIWRLFRAAPSSVGANGPRP